MSAKRMVGTPKGKTSASAPTSAASSPRGAVADEQTEQLSTLTRAMAQLTAHMTTLAQQQPAWSPAKVKSEDRAPNGRAKPRPPDVFSASGRWAARADIWFAAMEDYLSNTATLPEQQVSVVASFLDPDQQIWYRDWCNHLQGEVTLLKLKTAFLQCHVNPDRVKISRLQLRSMYQKYSLDQYINDFRALSLTVANMSKEDRIVDFIKGLKSDKVRHEVDRQSTQHPEWELSDVIRCAQSEERIQLRLAGPTAPASSQLNTVSREGQPSGRQRDRRNEPSKRPKMSYEVRQRCFAENRCFKCKQVGHSSLKCDQKASEEFPTN
jgi:hypothetical protein